MLKKNIMKITDSGFLCPNLDTQLESRYWNRNRTHMESESESYTQFYAGIGIGIGI